MMGYELSNSVGDQLCFHHEDWPKVFRMLCDQGWKPFGTIMSEFMIEQIVSASKNIESNYNYIFYLEDSSGRTSSVQLILESRLTSDQVETIQHNVDDYFDIECFERNFVGLRYRPYKVIDVEEKLPKPKGVLEPKEVAEHWCGGYLSNDGQIITEKDCTQVVRVISRMMMRGYDMEYSGLLNYEDELNNKAMVNFFVHGPITIW